MSISFVLPAVRVALAAGVAVALAGCAGETGLGWVGEAHDASSQSRSRTAASAPIPAEAEPEPIAESHPRLNRVVTLGEVDAVASGDPVPNGAPGAGPGVSVTINNYVNGASPGYGYGSANYGFSGSGSRFSAGSVGRNVSTPSASSPGPGQNWPAISDHGSSFPLRSAPASPWARTQ